MKLLSYISLVLFLIACGNEESKTVKRSTIIMGTVFEIQVRGVDETTANNAINAAFAEQKRLDTLFSTYLNNNNMWKLNNSKSEEMIVDDETFLMLKKSDEFWRLTEGAYDGAVGKLIDLVGFEKDSPELPSEEKIKEALKFVGWKHVQLKEPNILVKPVNVKISFNACVPGYAADRASLILEEYGIQDYLINAGGEIFAKGKNWKVGIKHPRNQDDLLGTILINGKAVATSGDYEKYFEKGGKRFSHIINPVTGSLVNEIVSVTILADDALTADGLSTGVFVMGVQKGLELIERLPSVEGIIVDTAGTVYKSSGIDNFLMR